MPKQLAWRNGWIVEVEVDKSKSPAQSAEGGAAKNNAESTAPVYRRDSPTQRAQGEKKKGGGLR